MAAVQLSRPGFVEAGRDAEIPLGGPTPAPETGPSRAPDALVVALLLVVLYAAFAHGAESDPAEARVQVGLSLVAAVAGIGWLWTGTIRIRAPSLALAGTALLVAFAAWNGLTLLWSVAPDQTWLELNRDLAYVIVLVLAIGVGASHPRPLRAIATAYLLVALVVTVYALGQKVVPGLHVTGLFDLNQTATFARLQAPFDYWNALALFLALAVPIALVIAVDRERSRRLRLASLLAVELMLLVIGLTYSRGGLIALVVAGGVSLALGRAWLRSLVLLAAAAVASAVPMWMALSVHSLSGANVSLGDREAGGGAFALVLILTLLGLYAVGRGLLAREARIELAPERVRQLTRLLPAVVGAAVVIGVVALALSSRGLGGTISHAWSTFTTPHATGNVNSPNLSVSSGNRWVWWKEAVGAWSDRPLAGWGAGSFRVLDRIFSPIGNLSVQDAHSVPLQWLAETGLIGVLLAIGGYALLLAGGLESTRRQTGAERAFAAALLAGAVAYAVHSLYDWDWDMPGVTFPVMVFLGALAGAGIRRETWRGSGRPPLARALALALCTLIVSIYALSALLPSLAATKASAALTQAAATSSTFELEHAAGTALLAARLDPLSDEGLTAAASISVYLRRPAQARSYLLQAVGRDPSDALAWRRLADLELRLRDVRATRQAIERVLELEPRAAIGRQLALELQQLTTPPNDSATATGTPLPIG